MDIVERRLHIDRMDKLDVQMIEVAKCNLHCWWCYLPDEIRHINEKYMQWFTASELLDMILEQNKDCKCIDISGGNPELTPELVYDFMMELEKRELSDKILIFSDDVLSTDYLLNFDQDKLKYMINYKNYAKVCCFKGFDPDSYSFNTLTDKAGFKNQLSRLKKYIELGFDTYCYVTFTCKDLDNVDEKIENFIESLQAISYYLPLRVVPIKIEKFSAVIPRLNDTRELSIENQYEVLDTWNTKVKKLYKTSDRSKNIADLHL